MAILWAPAIYFLDDFFRFAAFFTASLALGSFWLVIDIITRKVPDWRRAFWIIPNVFYVSCAWWLVVDWASPLAAIVLIIVLAIDWLVTDPFSAHIR